MGLTFDQTTKTIIDERRPADKIFNGGAVSAAKLATAYMLPYLPGDCLKIVVSVLLAPRILRAMARNS